MALSKRQIEMLKGMEGIDQTLLSAVERGTGDLSAAERKAVESRDTSKERIQEIASQDFVTPEVKKQFSVPGIKQQDELNIETGDIPELPDSDESIERITNLSTAMNEAVDLARQQRKDETLDLLGGIVPPGALPATSFASVLSAFNRSSAPVEMGFANQALDFAQQEEQNRLKIALDERDRIIGQQNDIRNLAMSVAEQGGDSATVNSVLSFAGSGDIDSAISAAAGYLNTKSKEEIIKVGSNLVRVNEDGEVEVLFSAKSGSGGGGAAPSVPEGGTDITGGFNFMTEGTNNQVKERAKEKLPQEFANRIISELTNENLRMFLNDYFEEQNMRQQSIDPELYYQQWRAAAGLDEEETNSGSSREPI